MTRLIITEKLDPKELVSFKEMLFPGVITSEALIYLLDRKNIFSKQELMEEMKWVQASMLKVEK